MTYPPVPLSGKGDTQKKGEWFCDVKKEAKEEKTKQTQKRARKRRERGNRSVQLVDLEKEEEGKSFRTTSGFRKKRKKGR